MNIFKTYHPFVNFIYFMSVIIFSVICTHPAYIAISFVFASLYMIFLKGKFIKYAVPIILVISVFYPAVNHEGITILAYLPDDNPLTMESIIYGVALAFSTTSALLWFFCCTKVLTTDKLMCIFGTFRPCASLIFSITLRFVPRFTEHMRISFKAHNGIGKGIKSSNVFNRIKLWISVFSATVTWAAENSIDISDSMQSRGYGVAKRSSFSLYRYKKTDMFATANVILLILYIVITPTNFQYFPYTNFNSIKITNIIVYSFYCSFPFLIEIPYKIKNRDVA